MPWITKIIDAIRGEHEKRLAEHVQKLESHHEEMRSELEQAQKQTDVLRELVTRMRGERNGSGL